MKGIRLLVLTLASISTVAASSTYAAVSLPTGWYVEGNLGRPHIQNGNYGTGTSISSTSGMGWNINGGFKFMPYFGVDAGYTQYGTSKVSTGGTRFATVNSRYSYQLALKGIIPVSDSGLEVFGKLGLARVSSHLQINNSAVASTVSNLNTGTSNNTGAYFGVGAGYNFTPSFAFNLQWMRAKGSSTTGNLDLYSAGLSYLFG